MPNMLWTGRGKPVDEFSIKMAKQARSLTLPGAYARVAMLFGRKIINLFF